MFIQTKIKMVLFIIAIAVCIQAEEKCELSYDGYITELNDSVVAVPEEMVALSYILSTVPVIEHINKLSGAASVFIIIDHSGPMCFESGKPPLDQWGMRFEIARNLIDSIFCVYDSAEIGVAVFRQYLYFDPMDDSIFMQCPEQDTGAYLPLLQLDSTYAPDEKWGYQILHEYLEKDTFEINGYLYADLSYRPSNFNSNPTTSNITAAFQAAKHAFKSARYPKNRQFIIFLTEGKATYPVGNENQYLKAVEGIPTTYTIFFSPNDDPPPDMVTMTNTINLSVMNDSSDLWPSSLGPDSLVDLMTEKTMKNGMQIIITQPTDIKINGIQATNIMMSMVTFDSPFPLKKDLTDFEYEIDYKIMKDSIYWNEQMQVWDTVVIQWDSLAMGAFTINVVDGASVPDHYPHTFPVYCWDRNLGFYHNAKPVTVADGSMKELEIRFTHDSVDIDYNYTNVSVEITQSNGPVNDKETFTLTDFDSLFSRTFPIMIDSTPVPGDGVLQLHEKDSIIAVFRNNESPKLPLDTIRLAILYNGSSAIDPNSFSSGKFHYHISRSGVGNHSISFCNLPGKGKLSLFSINGRTIFQQNLARGNSSINLPQTLPQSVFILHLSFGNTILKKIVLLY